MQFSRRDQVVVNISQNKSFPRKPICEHFGHHEPGAPGHRPAEMLRSCGMTSRACTTRQSYVLGQDASNEEQRLPVLTSAYVTNGWRDVGTQLKRFCTGSN